jgi:hypothetical protein
VPTTLAQLFANFALNTVAGGGASCRAAGYPSYLDIGAVQHADPAPNPTKKEHIMIWDY